MAYEQVQRFLRRGSISIVLTIGIVAVVAVVSSNEKTPIVGVILLSMASLGSLLFAAYMTLAFVSELMEAPDGRRPKRTGWTIRRILGALTYADKCVRVIGIIFALLVSSVTCWHAILLFLNL